MKIRLHSVVNAHGTKVTRTAGELVGDRKPFADMAHTFQTPLLVPYIFIDFLTRGVKFSKTPLRPGL
jgi:hypothetical protein